MELSERKLKILAAVVSSYIENGEPVGSKAIASDLGVSSATVRNEMAELSALGLLEQPHTSAGRVPSQRGYRLYIDRIMEKKTVSEGERKYIDSVLNAGAYDPERLLLNVSKVLAEITRLAAVSTTPSGNMAVVRAVQFVQTVIHGNAVHLAVLHVDAGHDAAILTLGDHLAQHMAHPAADALNDNIRHCYDPLFYHTANARRSVSPGICT